MLDWLKHALEWLKTPAKYFLPLLAASTFGLFAPLDILEFIGIEYWRNDAKLYLGSVFVVSCAVVGCHYASEIGSWLTNKYCVFLSKRSAKSGLKRLAPEEKELMARYLNGNTRTIFRAIDDPIAARLVKIGILYAPFRQGDIDEFPFTIHSWAWEYLHKYPHLVVAEKNVS